MRRFGTLLKLPIPDRDKINLELPSYTLDVNQIALKPPWERSPLIHGLACLEYHYFEQGSVELCVTPETAREIAQGTQINSLGQMAYARIQKTELFKARPASMTLALTDQEANELWKDIRRVLWPNVSNVYMTPRHLADVNQIFFHTVCSSTAANAAFVTLDNDILSKQSDLRERYGITVQSPDEAWCESKRRYSLYDPGDTAITRVWLEQFDLFKRLKSVA
jgi:hypothetical protein